MAEIIQPSDKIKHIFILLSQRTCMIKTSTLRPYFIDNIQKAAVICLIILTIFPFDAGSSIKIPGCMTYVIHPASSIVFECGTCNMWNDSRQQKTLLQIMVNRSSSERVVRLQTRSKGAVTILPTLFTLFSLADRKFIWRTTTTTKSKFFANSS